MKFSDGNNSVEDMIHGTNPTFTYKGYCATPEWDGVAFHGHAEGIRDMIHFAGDTIDEARQAFADSVDVYLEFIGQELADLAQELEMGY